MRPIEKRLDKLIRKLCRLTYHGMCYSCGREGCDSHHIVGRNHKRQRWNIENMVYLCREHHLEADNENLTFGRDLDVRVKIWSLGELEDIEAELKKKIKELQNESNIRI